jgi:hypothetical protein
MIPAQNYNVQSKTLISSKVSPFKVLQKASQSKPTLEKMYLLEPHNLHLVLDIAYDKHRLL